VSAVDGGDAPGGTDRGTGGRGARGRWWPPATLRGRLIALGTAGMVIGLAVGGLLLLAALRATLLSSVDTGARRTASDIAALVEADHLPDPLPVAGGPIVQVLDPQDRIRAASLGADRLTPLLSPGELAAARGGAVLVVDGSRGSTDGPLRVVAVDAGPAADRRTVVVAAPAGQVDAAVAAVRRVLLFAYPLLVAALAVAAWWVVGWTLRPVEALRRGAEAVTGDAPRLPVPDGRDEVHRLAVTLNGMLDRLAESRRRQRSFVSDAAHELRSPVTVLRTELEVAQRAGERVDPEDLLPEVRRLGRLVSDLLLLARGDEAGKLSRRVPVDVADVAREVAAERSGGRVPVRARVAGAAVVEGDPDALRRVLANLVDNAVRHAASRVVVEVGAPDGGRVLVRVLDDGPGIPAADRERVFHRFARLDDARTRDGGGAGLGLAIVRELVRLHGGTVSLADAAAGPGADGPGADGPGADGPDAAGPGLAVEVDLPASGV
jgi:signal transduction histidine kinase